jgi:hypothetical protein
VVYDNEVMKCFCAERSVAKFSRTSAIQKKLSSQEEKRKNFSDFLLFIFLSSWLILLVADEYKWF